MSRLESALRAIVADLSASRVRFALVGGLAVSSRTEPRFTRDVDLAVAVDDDREAESLVNGLLRCGYSVLATLEQTSARRLATVRLRVTGETAEGVVIDLLFASSGIESEVVAEADVLEVVPGLEVPVARLAHLIVLKLLARDEKGRPQDDVDLAGLLANATAHEIDDARRAIATVNARGFQRDKDLAAELDAALSRFRAG